MQLLQNRFFGGWCPTSSSVLSVTLRTSDRILGRGTQRCDTGLLSNPGLGGAVRYHCRSR